MVQRRSETGKGVQSSVLLNITHTNASQCVISNRLVNIANIFLILCQRKGHLGNINHPENHNFMAWPITDIPLPLQALNPPASIPSDQASRVSAHLFQLLLGCYHSRRTQQEYDWNRQRLSLFRLYFALLFQTNVFKLGN